MYNMVHTFYAGRLGNRMFEYALGRLIAVKKGYKFKVSRPIPFFPRTSDVVRGKERLDNLMVLTGQSLNWPAVLNHEGQIQCRRLYGQRWELYKDDLDLVLSWFNISNEEMFEIPDKGDLVVHLRLGDFVDLGIDLDTEMLLSVTETIPCKSKYIVTDSIYSSQALEFIRRGYKLFHKGLHEDFVFMKHASTLVMAQSTYSWWAGLLGTGEVHGIILKNSDKQLWTSHPSNRQIDLRVDLPRYTWHVL